MTEKKRVLISVSDKTGLKELAEKLTSNYDYEIVATGNTYKFLEENNIKNIIKSEDITEFNQLLDGKVKTLHPKIHAAILADPTISTDLADLKHFNIKPFNMVIVNLYPFEKVSLSTDDEDILVKNIDIGGVAILRAAAKNYKNITVVSDISQYEVILDELKQFSEITDQTRKDFSLAAFKLTSEYDSIILKKFQQINNIDHYLSINTRKIKELRYGENPHQKSSLYEIENQISYEILNGKELSYNNYLDMTSALNIISEFYDVASCAIVKHNTPCGVALGKDINEAYLKALDCDPISAFGGIVALSRTIDKTLAKNLVSIFLEVVIAPDFTQDALDILKTKKNLRLIKLNTPLESYKKIVNKEIKVTPFGILVQDIDNKDLNKETFKIVTKQKADETMIEDMIFAWKVAKHVKSNAIVIAKDFKTLGISGGQTSRIEAVEIALNKACDQAKDAVLASDGFFPAIDNIEAAAQNRIRGIIQPGGSIKDKDVIDTADKYSITMVTTSIRHFRH